jgi:type IV pilus assembly protein PilE
VRRSTARRRGGFSILEVVLVMALMGVMVSIALPTFQRALEQSKADLAVAELRAIAAAQRLYWLDNYNPQANTGYAADLATLQGLDLLDASILSASSPYAFRVATADASSFSVTATRLGSSVWTGRFAVDQAGNVTGSVQAVGQADIIPAPQ